jgi:O-antigen/teichoic acid export membrane protein
LSLVIARIFGADGMGAYGLSLTITTISSTLSRWGMDQATLKYMSIAVSDENWESARKIFFKSFSFISATSALMTIALYFFSPAISVRLFHNADLIPLLEVMSLSVMPFSLLNFLSECLRANKRIGEATLTQAGLLPVLTLSFLLIAYRQNYDLQVLAYSYITACFGVFAIGFWRWHKAVPFIWHTQKQTNEAHPNLFGTAGPMAWVAIVSMISGFSEIILLGIFNAVGDVGFYLAALRLAMLMAMVNIAFVSILAPNYASLYSNNRLGEMEFLTKRSMGLMFAANSPLFLAYTFVPDYILSLFGEEFIIAVPALQILMLGFLINVLGSHQIAMLMMSGQEKRARKIIITSSIISLGIGGTLIPSMGIFGAAFAKSLGMLTAAGMASYTVRKVLKIRAPL